MNDQNGRWDILNEAVAELSENRIKNHNTFYGHTVISDMVKKYYPQCLEKYPNESPALIMVISLILVMDEIHKITTDEISVLKNRL